MKSDAAKIRSLRQFTKNRASVERCREALACCDGDLDQAKAWLARTENDPVRPPDDAPEHWVYLVSKAQLYLAIGDPAIYRSQDFHGMPPEDTSAEELAEIDHCLRQFTQGLGYKADAPVTQISIGGFYAAPQTLHFQLNEQTAYAKGPKEFLDRMVFVHPALGHEITLYNLVSP